MGYLVGALFVLRALTPSVIGSERGPWMCRICRFHAHRPASISPRHECASYRYHKGTNTLKIKHTAARRS